MIFPVIDRGMQFLTFFFWAFLLCLKILRIIAGNYVTENISAHLEIGQDVSHQIGFFNQMSLRTITFPFRIISGADIIFAFSVGGLAFDRCEAASAILTE